MNITPEPTWSRSVFHQRSVRQKNLVKGGDKQECGSCNECRQRRFGKDANALGKALVKCVIKRKGRGNRHMCIVAILACVGISLYSGKQGQSQMAANSFGMLISDGLVDEVGAKPVDSNIIARPPPSVGFDLRGDKIAATMVEIFLRHCQPSTDDKHHPRDSPIHMISRWQREPACRMIAEHPIMMSAARTVMGLSPEAPLYLYDVHQEVKEAGDVHPLHSDMESGTPECGENGAATLWLMLESQCPYESSPLTFVVGSHKLHNAHQEFINRECYGPSNEQLPCNVDRILKEVEMANKNNITVVSGPSQPLMGIAWSTTAWHMTRDKCKRRAVTVKYTSSKSCARSLTFRYPEPSFAKFTAFPDKVPFVELGVKSQENVTNVNYPLDYLHRMPSTTKSNERCTEVQPPSENRINGALLVVHSIHLSGDYLLEEGIADHIGEFRSPKEPIIKSTGFFVQASRTFYDLKKISNFSPKPHSRETHKICAVIKGEINYAMAPTCDEYYDVISVRRGQVAVFVPGIFHLAAPSRDENGEHICFDFFPLLGDGSGRFKNAADAVKASRLATKSLTEDVEKYFANERTLNILDGKGVRPPGFRKLVVKEVQYQENEHFKLHVDNHDLIALTINGSMVIRSGNSTMVLPEHQHAFIPSGVEHGFEAQHGPVRMLFIEMR